MLTDSINIQFKEYSQGMDFLLPSRLNENIYSDTPVKLVNRIVDKLDINPLLSTCDSASTLGEHPLYTAFG